MTSKLIESNTGSNGVIADEATIAKAVGISYGGPSSTIRTYSKTSTLTRVMIV